MAKTVITRKEIRVPIGALQEVADFLRENDLRNSLIGWDRATDEIILEVDFTKDYKDAINKIKYIIADYKARQDDDEEDGGETEEEP